MWEQTAKGWPLEWGGGHGIAGLSVKLTLLDVQNRCSLRVVCLEIDFQAVAVKQQLRRDEDATMIINLMTSLILFGDVPS